MQALDGPVSSVGEQQRVPICGISHAILPSVVFHAAARVAAGLRRWNVVN